MNEYVVLLIAAVPFGALVLYVARFLAERSPNWPDRFPDTKKFGWAERLDNGFTGKGARQGT